MAERIARRAVVRGQVQGVFFRDSARRIARRAGVSGWIRNEADGSVQAHVEGEPAAVEEVLAYLGQGPEHAHVEGVDVREVGLEGARRFEVR